jgi:rod shape-determining protein MreC
MTQLLLRYRRALILSSTLLLSFVLMSLQVRSHSSLTDLTKQILLTSVSPALKVADLGRATVRSVWNEYIDLRHVRRDNLMLREQIRQLRTEVRELHERALEASRLGQLLQMRERVGAPALAARVIGKDATNWFRTILIDKGANAGVARHMPVVTSEGLVGRVIDVAPLAARVQLITDPESAVGCLVQRSRVTGVATGNLAGMIRIRYLPHMADVVVGDRVTTSGMGGVFPKGIPVGRVARSSRPGGALFQETEVQPLVDFSRVEEVVVLTQPPTRDFSRETGEQAP